MNAFSHFGCLALAVSFANISIACDGPCDQCNEPPCLVAQSQPSWIFRRSTYTHDPYTGARVAQFMRTPPVEPLEDERLVTSRYHRTRTNLRGADGSIETYYDVQSWGNGRGGIDAEWERFHDAWKESYLQGGYYNQGPGYGGGWPGPWGYSGFNGGYGGPGYGYGGAWNWGQGPWQGSNGHHNGDHNHSHGGDE
jgi:hypothetical protein